LARLAALSAASAFSGGVDSDATIEIFPEGIGNPCSDRELPLFLDLDGTLVDGVYQHVLAWHEALEPGKPNRRRPSPE
jgi:hypothetical protein